MIGWHDPTYWPQNIVVPWQLASLHGSCHLQLCTAGITAEHIHKATLLCIHQCHPPFVWKHGKLHRCGDVLGRTCCTNYTPTQSCTSLKTVHNEYNPRYFSRMVELGHYLSNIHVQGMGLLLLLQGMGVYMLLQGVGMRMGVLLLLIQGMGVLLMLRGMGVLILLKGMGRHHSSMTDQIYRHLSPQ